MEIWRISNYADLAGIGGLRAAGRWHSRGRPIVYLADHESSALLEILVHTDRDLIPANYQLLRVVVPDDIVVEAIGAALPPDWREQKLTSREIGDRWLDRAASALLRVPSAISATGNNYLLNPEHPDSGRIAVAEVIKASFDSRLLP